MVANGTYKAWGVYLGLHDWVWVYKDFIQLVLNDLGYLSEFKHQTLYKIQMEFTIL